MMTRGTLLGVEGTVDGGTYDVPQGSGYAVANRITVEGLPGEKVVLDGLWDSIEEAGDLPVYAKVTLTWAGHEWPWTKDVSKFDVDYQAVHMAEGSILVTIAGLIMYALPYLASILLVLLGWDIWTTFKLKQEDVGNWLDQYGGVIGAGIGAGAVILVGLMLLGGDKK